MGLGKVGQNGEKVWEGVQEGNEGVVTGKLMGVKEEGKVGGGVREGEDGGVKGDKGDGVEDGGDDDG